MTTTALLCAIATVLAIVFGIIYWITESREQRIRRWSKQGTSQRAIADRMQITRHQVRKALAA